jgi:hypothetical protein
MPAGLRTLIQTRHGPDRYVLSTFFDTMRSALSRHACTKTIGPSSTMCSLNRMPASVLATGEPARRCGRGMADSAVPRSPFVQHSDREAAGDRVAPRGAGDRSDTRSRYDIIGVHPQPPPYPRMYPWPRSWIWSGSAVPNLKLTQPESGISDEKRIWAIMSLSAKAAEGDPDARARL